jgi:predicted ABC-type ATPase
MLALRASAASASRLSSHPSKVDILRRARAAGFHVQMFFVGIDDPQTNVERVALRVALGGHDVPADRIVARWHRTMSFLAEAVRVTHRSLVFDNSGSANAGPRLAIRLHLPSDGAMTSKQYPPIPGWVRHFVLHPLKIPEVD